MEIWMVTQDKIEKFIELRSQGFSYQKIAKILGVSKPTLIKLNRQHEKEIANQKFFNVESLLRKYQLSRDNKVKLLCKLLNKINTELLNKDFDKLGIKDLLKIRKELDKELKLLLDPILYKTGEKLDLLHTFADVGDVVVSLD